MRLLNLGCGPVIAEGWVNVDRAAEYEAMGALRADVAFGLPFDDDSFDGVLANHSLQQLPERHLPMAIGEVHRVLRVGGIFRVIVPDVVAAFNAWRRDDYAHWPGFAAIEEPMTIDAKLTRYLTWGGTNRTCFTAGSLWLFLVEVFGAGRVEIGARGVAFPSWCEGLDALDTRLGESIVAEARK